MRGGLSRLRGKVPERDRLIVSGLIISYCGVLLVAIANTCVYYFSRHPAMNTVLRG